MKGLGLFVLCCAFLPVTLVRPFLGMMYYNWFALMKPDALFYGFPRSVPMAFLIGAGTFIGWLVSRERKLPPIDATSVLIMLMLFWMTVTSIFALDQTLAWSRYWDLFKILLFSLIMYSMLTTPVRVQTALWIVVIFIGIFAAKGGLFSFMAGGGSRVFGPNRSVIEDNNNFGVAMVATLPLMFAARTLCTRAWMRHGMTIFIALSMLGTLLTYSRGAMLAAAVMTAIAWLRSRRKLIGALSAVLALAAFLQFAPPAWFARFNTIQTYQDDASAMDRLQLWAVTWAMVTDRPITGAGFWWMKNHANANRYAMAAGVPPVPADLGVAHSIYFENLGDHGFVGLFIYLALVGSVIRNGLWLARQTKGKPDEWYSALGRMAPASMVGFLTGGAFASVATFEGFYQIFIIIAAARAVVTAAQKSAAPAPMTPAVMPVRDPVLALSVRKSSL